MTRRQSYDYLPPRSNPAIVNPVTGNPLTPTMLALLIGGGVVATGAVVYLVAKSGATGATGSTNPTQGPPAGANATNQGAGATNTGSTGPIGGPPPGSATDMLTTTSTSMNQQTLSVSAIGGVETLILPQGGVWQSITIKQGAASQSISLSGSNPYSFTYTGGVVNVVAYWTLSGNLITSYATAYVITTNLTNGGGSGTQYQPPQSGIVQQANNILHGNIVNHLVFGGGATGGSGSGSGGSTGSHGLNFNQTQLTLTSTQQSPQFISVSQGQLVTILAPSGTTFVSITPGGATAPITPPQPTTYTFNYNYGTLSQWTAIVKDANNNQITLWFTFSTL